MFDWIKEATSENISFNETLSFDEYMAIFEKNPYRECRPTAVYLKDMLDHFGKDDQGRYNLFLEENIGLSAVYGQDKPIDQIYNNLNNFLEEGYNNKLILLVGPNGSAKSSIINKLMNGSEKYSETDEGCLYTFSWVFPIDNYVKGTLGLSKSGQKSEHHLTSYAHLDDKDISAILHSELKDAPILLIPKVQRQKFIEQSLKSWPSLLDTVRKSYLYNGDLSKRNHVIFEALLKNYKGDYKEVLKHIRVERFTISKRYSSSAVTIEPQLHVDAKLQQISMDKRLASLPPSLQSLNLFSMYGEVVLSNRGILEFSDLLKRPLDAFKYLLMTIETKNINLQGILTELDIFFIGSSNEIHLSAFKQHPDYNSFKARINFIRVPYLTHALNEKNIYKEQVHNLKDKVTFEPGSLYTLCLFAVMTRLRPCSVNNYHDKKLGQIASSLNPLEKTLYLAENKIPERFNSEDAQILSLGRDEIINEYVNDGLYEGKFGISPREMKQLLYQISGDNNTITYIEIIDFLTDLIQKKQEYDFLNISPQGDYNNPSKYISLLNSMNLDVLDNQVRDCLDMVDNRSYDDYIRRYILNINCLIKGEKIRNPITGQYQDVDMYFIKEFENNMALNEKPEDFRSHLLSKLGAFSLDNPGKKISYIDVFPEVVFKLQQSFREEQKKHLQKIAQGLVFYQLKKDKENKPPHTLSKEQLLEIETILDNMQSKYEYSRAGALSLVRHLLKERY